MVCTTPPTPPKWQTKKYQNYLNFLSSISPFLASPMCQVAHCTFWVMCTIHVHSPRPWPSVWQGHWGLQVVGPIELGYRGGLGTPKTRPGPPVGHPTTPSHYMPALMGQLGPWAHWVGAPGAHTSPLWAHATTQVDPTSLQADTASAHPLAGNLCVVMCQCGGATVRAASRAPAPRQLVDTGG